MKYLKVSLFLALCLAGWNVQSAVITAEDLGVEKFTDLGAGKVRWEQGKLFLKQGFIPITSGDYGFDTFNLTQGVVSAISGKFVINLSTWTAYDNAGGGGYLAKFSRSVETYSVNNVPYVIVSVAGVGGGATVKTPKVSISAVDAQATETPGDTAQFLVALNAPTTKNIRVKLDISGKATKGKDYLRIPPSLLIPAGNVSGIIEVTPVNDVQHEGTENIVIKLARGGIKGYTVGKPAAAKVNILDND